MGTKTISITEEAYNRLDSRKKERESFSEVINRLTGKGSLARFSGVFSKAEAEELGENIRKSRLASRFRRKCEPWVGMACIQTRSRLENAGGSLR